MRRSIWVVLVALAGCLGPWANDESPGTPGEGGGEDETDDPTPESPPCRMDPLSAARGGRFLPEWGPAYSGEHLYFEPIGQPKISARGNESDFEVIKKPDETRLWIKAQDGQWQGIFSWNPDCGTKIRMGTYGNLTRVQHGPQAGGIDWTMGGIMCGDAVGATIVDSVEYDGDALMELALRMEFHCDYEESALMVSMRWTSMFA